MLRFRCDASGNNDWVYIDDVVISGCEGEIVPTCTDGVQNGDETGVDCGGVNCVPCATGCQYADISSDNFESGLGIWNDGGGDAELVSNSSYATSGSGVLQLRDNSGDQSSMFTNDFDLSGYSELTVSFNFTTVSFENNEDFFLEYSLGGGVYTPLVAYQQGNNTQNGVTYSDEVIIPGPFSSTTSIRFRCDASSNSDWVYIDDAVIAGCYNCIGCRLAFDNARLKNALVISREEKQIDFELYPNPVNGILNVHIMNLNTDEYQVRVTDMSGKLIESSDLSMERNGNTCKLNSEKLSSDLYNLSIYSNQKVISKRFIVQH
ncbi:MAG: T9SS type A sorting domain-containing protein [Bacteroidia bacterium]